MPSAHSVLIIIAALIPIFSVILLGYALKRLRFLNESQWPPLDRINYFILFPVLLMVSIGKAKIDTVDLGPLLGTIIGTVLIITALTVAIRRWCGTDGAGFTSVVQGSIRFNTYVTLAAAGSLLGPPGLAQVALAIAVIVPLINILSVACLLHWGAGGGRFSLGAFVNQLIRNPLVIGCVLGLSINLAGGFPDLIRPTFEILASASLPLGLLSVGASMDWQSARQAGRPVLISSALKLLAFPLVAHGLARALGADPLTVAVCTLFGAMPTATAAVVLARQMGGDVRVMAAITTFETLAAALTIPVLLALLGVT